MKFARDRWLPMAAWAAGAVGLLSALMLAGSSVYGLTIEKVVGFSLPAAVAVVIAASCFLPRRPELVIIQNRALLMSGEREMSVLGPGTSFIVLVRKREATKTGQLLLESVRWWIFVPGRGALWVDDLSPRSTPWVDDIAMAVARPPTERWPGMCPGCGYSTAGLTGDICPECGTGLSQR